MIHNPILPGFNPDPSICRVGDDYYIATSTFEWFPGVQIHHSRDLANWRLITRPLDRPSQLDMRGNPDSAGVWAPCLSHSDGLFWLVYTDVKRIDGAFKDAHNFIVTAAAIAGPWSDPIYVNSSGFDPSLFHDDDGRKWFLNMLWDHRDDPRKLRKHPGFRRHPAAAMGRWLAASGRRAHDHFCRQPARPRRRPASAQAQRLVLSDDRRGRHRIRSRGDDGSRAPHRGPLRLASSRASHHVEGCAGRSAATRRTRPGRRNARRPDLPHASLLASARRIAPIAAWTRNGDSEMRLARRRLALPGTGRADSGGRGSSPFAAAAAPAPSRQRAVFDQRGLPLEFQWLRTPEPQRIFSLDARPGWLRLIGRESLGSWFEQALVARRQQHFAYRAETELEFAPQHFQQCAGLVAYYNRYKFHALAVTRDDAHGRVLTQMSCNGDYPEGRLSFSLPAPTPLGDVDPVRLAALIDGPSLQFGWDSADGWRNVGPGSRRLAPLRRSRRRRTSILHRRLCRHVRLRRLWRRRAGGLSLFRLRRPQSDAD